MMNRELVVQKIPNPHQRPAIVMVFCARCGTLLACFHETLQLVLSQFDLVCSCGEKRAT